MISEKFMKWATGSFIVIFGLMSILLTCYIALRTDEVWGYEIGSGMKNLKPDFAYKEDDSEICIGLPENYDSGNIEISAIAEKNMISIIFKNAGEDFLGKKSIGGTGRYVDRIAYGYEQDELRVDIITTAVTECSYEISEDELLMRLKSPAEVYEHIVLIDPGHGGDDKGSVVYGIREDEVCYELACRLRDELKGRGIGAYMTRGEEENPSEEERLAMTDMVSANALIQIHCNADAKTRVTNGAELFYNNRAAEPLAGAVYGCFTEGLSVAEPEIREMQGSDNTLVLLLRAGFLTNRQEAVNLENEEFQEEYAKSLADGIEEYFKNE